ncbi:alcohol dehydrogenase catalytic domain-containing protein [candidate division KSB3 bacterium]|uniref:Alcohol dehydrogenase catalytic domain-containing protein n=1 Tax=candidate division KSB3 bacterium TaxID=2044937 RepID=A0A9D5Q4P3_9BACT|nr:alcohol dehydrogenase catalytic domain-containing protein [candidate division KSB3 bacterium]MBD3323397.1 alcohol dehydrogenase catalytic domain-containing protein [candidate division KSB3 bacterium]
MRAAVLYGKEDLRIREVAIPEITDNEVLLQVKRAFVCGTDVRMFRNGHTGVSEETPLILGHEMSGVIARVGKNVPGYHEGMAVTVAPNMGCGICDMCVSGNTQLCPYAYKALGITIDGGFAEYVKIPEAAVRQGNITELPPGMSFEEAAIVEPLSCAYNGFTKCSIEPGDSVLIIGGGPIGIMHARLAKMAGAGKIFINDISDDRLALCRKADPVFTTLGVDPPLQDQIQALTDGRGVDVCITACPVPQVQTLALELTALNGRVLFFGGLPADKATVSLNTNIIHYKQLLVTGTTRSSLSQFRTTLALIANGLIEVKDLITSRATLDEMQRTIENVAKGIGLKSTIVFE